MYQDPMRWGITLQTYIQLTMLDRHLSAIVGILNFLGVFLFQFCGKKKTCFGSNPFQFVQMYAVNTVLRVFGKTCDAVADKLTKNLEKKSVSLA